MTKVIGWAALTAAISLVIYIGIAFFFIFTSRIKEPESSPYDFSSLKRINYRGLPGLKYFTAGDNARLAYRHYPAESRRTLILLHGSAYHSRYLFPLARFISSNNLARVYTPNIRGHEGSGPRRGNVRYIGRLEDDLADLIGRIKGENPEARIILGGHSSGGGLAVRFGGGKHGRLADAYLLLAPFLQYDAPSVRRNAGSWATPYVGRIIGLTMLNRIGFRFLNHMIVIRFNMPEAVRDGTETLDYSYALNVSITPRRDYKADLRRIARPLLVLVGSEDEAFIAEKFPEELKDHPTARVRILPGAGHLDIVVNPETQSVLADWINRI